MLVSLGASQQGRKAKEDSTDDSISDDDFK